MERGPGVPLIPANTCPECGASTLTVEGHDCSIIGGQRVDTGGETGVTSLSPMGDYVHRPFSPSSISSFKECQRKWGYPYLNGVVGPDKPSTRLGTKVHARKEMWFREGIHPCDPQWGPMDHEDGNDDPGVIAESGLHMWPAPGSVSFDIEKDIKCELDGFTFVGSMDLGFYVESTGRYVVGDHKTTSDLKWAKSVETLKGSDPQGLIYPLAAMQRRNEDVVDCQWGYVLTKKGRRKAKAVQFTQTRMEVEAAMREHIIPVARLIREALDKGLKAEDMPQNPNACASFGGCPFIERCALKPIDRLRASMAQETIAQRAARMKAGQANAVAKASTVEAVEVEESRAGVAQGAINPPERHAPGSLAAKLVGGTATGSSGPASGTEGAGGTNTHAAPSAGAGEAPKAETIVEKVARLARERQAAKVVETPKAPEVEPAKVAVTVNATEVVAREVVKERVTRVEEGNTVKDGPKVPREKASKEDVDAGRVAMGLPFVLLVGCVSIGQGTNGFGALDILHREFCEAHDVTDMRELNFNQSAGWGSFVAERFESMRFEGFVTVDPRVHFIREAIPVLERRAYAVIRSLAY